MKKVKKGLRLLVVVLLLILAAVGIGITGSIFNNNRERYMNKEIKTEQVNKKEDEENEGKSKN